MRCFGVAVGCSLALVGVARADVATPGELLFDDAVVDVAGARIARKSASRARCDYMETAWERGRRAWADAPGNAGSYFVAATPHRILSASDPFSQRRRAFRLTELPSRIAHPIVGGAVAAIVEDPSGALLGLVEIDEEAHEIRFREPDGNVRWRLARKNLWGDSAALVVDGTQIVITHFSRYASGSRLLALDLQSGALRWEGDVEQPNVAHSEYYNDVTVEKRGDAIVLRGTEAGGCYLQIFDHATGKRRLSLMRSLW